MKHLICYCFLLSIGMASCQLTNPANQIAKELYPAYGHLSLPEHSFEQMWHLFDKLYAFFEEKEVDWEASYHRYRPQVTSTTSESELIDIFAQMLNPLKDGHVRLIRADTNLVQLERKPCQFAKRFDGQLREFQDNTFEVLRTNGFDSITPIHPTEDYAEQGYDHLYYYSQSDKLAYLRIVDCRDQMAQYEQILEAIQPSQGLIIDLRYNLGGSVGREMASKFLPQKKVYGYKRVKRPSGLSDPIDLKAIPKGQTYTKPIVVLINDATFSSAEDFALVLAGETHVTLVGSYTGGYLSDVFNYRLPNGMNVHLSHEQYYSTDSLLLEDRGIEPDILLENQWKDFRAGKDPLIDKAISILQ
ncbi:MAG: S41 family peptidase [Bacteroidota bacterium]